MAAMIKELPGSLHDLNIRYGTALHRMDNEVLTNR